MTYIQELEKRIQSIEKGGKEKYHQRNKEKGKLFVRERLERIFDEDLDIEDAFFARRTADLVASDRRVRGIGRINEEDVCLRAHDLTVRARAWGKRTVDRTILTQRRA